MRRLLIILFIIPCLLGGNCNDHEKEKQVNLILIWCNCPRDYPKYNKLYLYYKENTGFPLYSRIFDDKIKLNESIFRDTLAKINNIDGAQNPKEIVYLFVLYDSNGNKEIKQLKIKDGKLIFKSLQNFLSPGDTNNLNKFISKVDEARKYKPSADTF